MEKNTRRNPLFSPLHQAWQQHRFAVCMVVFFAVVMGMETFVNHLNYRTYSLDLGVYTNALWDYAHGQWNDSRTFLSRPINLLHDHFDLYLLLFSPFSYVFGSYTLLVMQWFFVLFGAVGFYRWMLSDPNRASLAIKGLLFYLSFFGIYAALSFDYHSNVVAASLFPWFWMAFEKGKKGLTFLWLVLMVIGKENVSLWLAAVGISSFFLLPHRVLSSVVTLFSITYFLIITQWVMPAMDTANGSPMRFAYSVLGPDMKSAVIYLLSHPLQAAEWLFFPHAHQSGFEWAKMEFWLFMIGCGFLFVIQKPAFLIAFAPLILQKMFHDQPTLWGVEAHYTIEFLPLLGILVFSVIAAMREPYRRFFSYGVVVLTMATTVRMMDHTTIWMDRSRLRIYSKAHYPNWEVVKERTAVLKAIPETAIVSATNVAVPHLALRDQCYTFPDIPEQTTHVVIIPDSNEGEESLLRTDAQVNELLQSGQWKMNHQSPNVKVLERVKH